MRLAVSVDMSRGFNVRVSGTVGAAVVAALGACLAASGKERLALVAGSANPLSGLLVNEILSSSLAGALEDDVLGVLRIVRVVGDDGSVLLLGLEDGGALLPARDALGLGPLGRVADALGATDVLAGRALFGGGEGSVALVARSVNTHADGLLDAESGALGGDPLALLNLEAESLAQLSGALLKQLGSGHLDDALEVLVLALGRLLGGLLGGGSRGGGGGGTVIMLDSSYRPLRYRKSWMIGRNWRLRSAGLSGRLSRGGNGRLALGGGSLEDGLGSSEHLSQALLFLRDRRPGLRWRTHDCCCCCCSDEALVCKTWDPGSIVDFLG